MTAPRKGIAALEALMARHDLKVVRISEPTLDPEELIHVRFHLDGRSWELFVADEYEEFRESRKLLALYMVLDALRDYDIYKDYLEWSRDYEVDPADETFRSYYMGLNKTYHEIKAILGDFHPILKQIHFQFPWRNKEDARALLREF